MSPHNDETQQPVAAEEEQLSGSSIFVLKRQQDGSCTIEWEGQALSAECVGRSTLLAQLVEETECDREPSSHFSVPFGQDVVSQWLEFSVDVMVSVAGLCNILKLADFLGDEAAVSSCASRITSEIRQGLIMAMPPIGTYGGRHPAEYPWGHVVHITESLRQLLPQGPLQHISKRFHLKELLNAPLFLLQSSLSLKAQHSGGVLDLSDISRIHPVQGSTTLVQAPTKAWNDCLIRVLQQAAPLNFHTVLLPLLATTKQTSTLQQQPEIEDLEPWPSMQSVLVIDFRSCQIDSDEQNNEDSFEQGPACREYDHSDAPTVSLVLQAFPNATSLTFPSFRHSFPFMREPLEFVAPSEDASFNHFHSSIESHDGNNSPGGIPSLSSLQCLVINQLPYDRDALLLARALTECSCLTRLEIHHKFGTNVEEAMLEDPSLTDSVVRLSGLKHLVLPLVCPRGEQTVTHVQHAFEKLRALPELTWLRVDHQPLSMDASNALVFDQSNIGEFLYTVGDTRFFWRHLKTLHFRFKGSVTPPTIDIGSIPEICTTSFRECAEMLDELTIQGAGGDLTWLLGDILQGSAGAVRSLAVSPRFRLCPQVYYSLRHLTALTQLSLEDTMMTDSAYSNLQSAVTQLSNLRKLHLADSPGHPSLLCGVTAMPALEDLDVKCCAPCQNDSSWQSLSDALHSSSSSTPVPLTTSLTGLTLRCIHKDDLSHISMALRRLPSLRELQWQTSHTTFPSTPDQVAPGCAQGLNGLQFLANMKCLQVLEIGFDLHPSEYSGVGALLGALTDLTSLKLKMKEWPVGAAEEIGSHITSLHNLRRLHTSTTWIPAVAHSAQILGPHAVGSSSVQGLVSTVVASSESSLEQYRMQTVYARRVGTYATGLGVPISDLQDSFADMIMPGAVDAV